MQHSIDNTTAYANTSKATSSRLETAHQESSRSAESKPRPPPDNSLLEHPETTFTTRLAVIGMPVVQLPINERDFAKAMSILDYKIESSEDNIAKAQALIEELEAIMEEKKRVIQEREAGEDL